MANNQRLFATLPRRLKASIIDGIILLSLFIISLLAIGAVIDNETVLKPIAILAPVLLIEPLLITYLGFTIGQYIFGIQVVRVTGHSKCPLLVSFVRFYTKILLGSLSLVYMLFSKSRQAIHDHLAKTIVVLSKRKLEMTPEFAEHGESEQILEEEYTYPTPIRRFGLFVLWYVVVSIVFGILIEAVALLTVPEYSIDTDKLPESIDTASGFVLSILFFVLAVLAAKGYLPGAKRKRKELGDSATV